MDTKSQNISNGVNRVIHFEIHAVAAKTLRGIFLASTRMTRTQNRNLV